MLSILREDILPLTRRKVTGNHPVFKTVQRCQGQNRPRPKEILKFRDQVPKFHEVSADQKNISKGDQWRTFFLFGFGTKLARNCAMAPKAAAMLESFPNLQTAWFSILAPGTYIPPHKFFSQA